MSGLCPEETSISRGIGRTWYRTRTGVTRQAHYLISVRVIPAPETTTGWCSLILFLLFWNYDLGFHEQIPVVTRDFATVIVFCPRVPAELPLLPLPSDSVSVRTWSLLSRDRVCLT